MEKQVRQFPDVLKRGFFTPICSSEMLHFTIKAVKKPWRMLIMKNKLKDIMNDFELDADIDLDFDFDIDLDFEIDLDFDIDLENIDLDIIDQKKWQTKTTLKFAKGGAKSPKVALLENIKFSTANYSTPRK